LIINLRQMQVFLSSKRLEETVCFFHLSHAWQRTCVHNSAFKLSALDNKETNHEICLNGQQIWADMNKESTLMTDSMGDIPSVTTQCH
jgi:hypothetical protein